MFCFSSSAVARGLATIACCTAIVPAYAGRPLATDDAAIVEPGACQLEAWIERSPGAQATWLNPGCNPFGSTEFSLGTARQREDGAPTSTLQSWQIKHLLRAYGEHQAGFAVALGGQRDRRSGDRETLLKGMVTLPLAGDRLLVHVNAGAVHQHTEQQKRYRGTWGLALDTEVLPSTRASLETFGVSSQRTNWQLGLRHELIPGRLQLDASVGSAFGRWSDSRVVTLGLIVVSPAFLR